MPPHLGRSRVPSSLAGRGTAPCSGRRAIRRRSRTAGSPPRTSPPDTLRRKQRCENRPLPRCLSQEPTTHQTPHPKDAAGSTRKSPAVTGGSLAAGEDCARGPGCDRSVIHSGHLQPLALHPRASICLPGYPACPFQQVFLCTRATDRTPNG